MNRFLWGVFELIPYEENIFLKGGNFMFCFFIFHPILMQFFFLHLNGFKARLHDQSFRQKIGQSFRRKIYSKKTLTMLSRLHDQSLINVFIPSYLSVVNSKTNKMAEFEKYPTMLCLQLRQSWQMKTFKNVDLLYERCFGKIAWVSIPSKYIIVLWQFFFM